MRSSRPYASSVTVLRGNCVHYDAVNMALPYEDMSCATVLLSGVSSHQIEHPQRLVLQPDQLCPLFSASRPASREHLTQT
jgi:hypothetical protein